MLLNGLIKRIDTNTEKIKKMQLNPAIKDLFEEDRLITQVYSTNALEGNTLSLAETKLVLEGANIPNKELREIFEVVNSNKAIKAVNTAVKNNEHITEDFIKKLHSYLLDNIRPEYAGVYRDCDVWITGASFSPPKPKLVNNEMKNLINTYNSESFSKLSHVEKAAKLHIDFVRIHPFIDGNGRVSRLLMNYGLLKNKLPAISISPRDRTDYILTLDSCHLSGNHKMFASLIANNVIKEQELIIKNSKSINESKNITIPTEDIKKK